MKRIALDSGNFKDLQNRNGYYVDKTGEMREWFELDTNIILMPRPRRFGKTLFLSTIYYFFSNREQDETLFKETSIYNTPFFKEHFGKYPVISLTFKDVKEKSFDLMLKKVKKIIRDTVIDLLKNIETKNEVLTKIIENKSEITDYEEALKLLTEALTEYYKVPCIVLIDEYDSPVITAYLKGYYEDAIDFFRNMFGAVFKGNELNIKKALITGILRISQESMFSGLNNLETLTILDKDLSSSCGFTKEETVALLNYYGIRGETEEKAIRFYNSYIFGEKIITNPWSILNFVKKKEFEPYWANTSSNDFLYHLIEKSRDFRANLDKLLRNDPIDIEVNKHLTFRDRELYKKNNLFSLLFFSGYLKCKERYIRKIGEEEYLHCKMIPTNVECNMIFRKIISNYVEESFENYNVKEILESLIKGYMDRFEELLSYALRDLVSYHDLQTENSYHMFLLGILVNLSNNYEIISNVEAGYGRVDIILLHKRDKEKLAIVMELKKINSFKNETKDVALEKAVKQIEEKEYVSFVKKRGYKNILAFGLVFDGKRCWIREIEK